MIQYLGESEYERSIVSKQDEITLMSQFRPHTDVKTN
jgi:hypothetical protein